MNRTISLIAVTTAAFACGGSKSPVELPNDPQLTLSAENVVVDVGASTVVSATVRNATDAAQYLSRDPSIATVAGNGSISGIAAGTTYVVASLANRAEVRDSVRVTVRLPVVAVDSCAIARPSFGAPATAADRAVFAYDVSAPLNFTKFVDSTAKGIEFNRIAFDSPGGGRATGIMYVPIGRTGLRPGIVSGHASGAPNGPVQGARIAQFEMASLAERGAIVIAIDAPYARRGGTVPPSLDPIDRIEHIQYMKELQRAVDVLLSLGTVDPARIGYTGYSFGGMIGIAFAGIERRLKAAVITAGHGGSVTAATNRNLLQGLNTVTCARRASWFRENVPIEPIRYISGASPVALLFQIGRQDAFVLPEDAQQAYDAASSPKEVIYYDSGHALPVPQAPNDRYGWLSKQIGIDP